MKNKKIPHDELKSGTSKRIRKGDKVYVTAGEDRKRTGTVLRIMGAKAVVEGINVCKKSVKRSEQNPQGGIIEIEKPVHISNLRICVDENKPVKLQVRKNSQGNRELFYNLDGEDVLYRNIKKQNT